MKKSLCFGVAALACTLALPAPAQQFNAFQAGITRVQEVGNKSGPPVIFIPGLACGPWVWDAQVAALSPRYHLFLVTLPGFNRVPFTAEPDLVASAAQSIHGLIAAKGLRKPIIVGHSLGGTIAVFYGETYPRDRAEIISVEGGYPVAPTQAARNASTAKSIAPFEHVPQSKLAKTLLDDQLQYTITNPAQAQRIARLSARSDPKAIVEWMKSALSRDLTPALARIDQRFTVIIPFDALIDPYQGFKNSQEKLAAYRAWAKHAPQSHVTMILQSRHFVMLDQPQQFEAALESALQD